MAVRQGSQSLTRGLPRGAAGGGIWETLRDPPAPLRPTTRPTPALPDKPPPTGTTATSTHATTRAYSPPSCPTSQGDPALTTCQSRSHSARQANPDLAPDRPDTPGLPLPSPHDFPTHSETPQVDKPSPACRSPRHPTTPALSALTRQPDTPGPPSTDYSELPRCAMTNLSMPAPKPDHPTTRHAEPPPCIPHDKPNRPTGVPDHPTCQVCPYASQRQHPTGRFPGLHLPRRHQPNDTSAMYAPTTAQQGIPGLARPLDRSVPRCHSRPTTRPTAAGPTHPTRRAVAALTAFTPEPTDCPSH